MSANGHRPGMTLNDAKNGILSINPNLMLEEHHQYHYQKSMDTIKCHAMLMRLSYVQRMPQHCIPSEVLFVSHIKCVGKQWIVLLSTTSSNLYSTVLHKQNIDEIDSQHVGITPV